MNRDNALARVWLPGLFLLGVAAVDVRSQGQPARLDTSAAAVVDAAAAYVKTYQEELSFVIADEIYTQQVRNQVPPDNAMPRSRTLKSELFFMFAPADRTWMAIRDVTQVDGKPVDHRPDLKSALQTLPAQQVAGTFKTYNSRFNLGRVIRNFNEPTLSLLVLDPEVPRQLHVRTGARRQNGRRDARDAGLQRTEAAMAHPRPEPAAGLFAGRARRRSRDRPHPARAAQGEDRWRPDGVHDQLCR